MLRIAVRMLLGEPARWMGVVLGVFFCTFLITHLLSMFSGMMQRSYALVSDIREADIWVMDPAVEYVDEPFGLPATAVDRVRGVDGVAWAVPLYTGSLRARMASGALRPILVIGVDDATLIGAPRDMLAGSLADIRLSDGVVVDDASSRGLLQVPLHPQPRLAGWQAPQLTGPLRPLTLGDELLVNDRRLTVVGVARLTPRFMSRPIIYTTYSRAVEMSPRQRNLLSFVLVKCADGADPPSVARAINERTGLRARTHQQFAADTYWYYVRTTGVVARMGLMVSIGVAVGVSVSSLLLYLFTIDNARYYATFKALGATNSRIARMVIVQALVCGATGYGLGVGVSSAVGTFVKTDAMPYSLNQWTMLFTLAAVLLVCVVSAILSATRVFRLDPASVFNK
ncbi:MAG: ABC transporter permease [Phycisphaerales bacterium]